MCDKSSQYIEILEFYSNVNACLKKLARSLEDHIDEILQCYDEFFNEAKEMVIYDIANNVFGIGCSVCGDSCIPILESDHSVKISVSKRDKIINSISPYFTKDQIDKARLLINNDSRNLRQITKGHFQTSFVLNVLKKMSSKINGNKVPSISKDSLFALLVNCYAGCGVDCEERKVVRQKVVDAIAALK